MIRVERNGLPPQLRVETARNRAHLLRQTREGARLHFCLGLTDICMPCGGSIVDAAVEFGIQPGAQAAQPDVGAFVQQQFAQFHQQQQTFQQLLDRHLSQMEAAILNTSISARNQRSLADNRLLMPLRKHVGFSLSIFESWYSSL